MTGAASLQSLVLSGGAGFVIGLLYFAGLWWTARRVGRSRAPVWLLAGSFAVRMALLLVALYAVTRGEPVPVAAALLGVWAARRAAVAYVRSMAGPEGEGTGADGGAGADAGSSVGAGADTSAGTGSEVPAGRGR